MAKVSIEFVNGVRVDTEASKICIDDKTFDLSTVERIYVR
jgi:hypothetical protein